MSNTRLKVVLDFKDGLGYIAQPFWPALNELIDIHKVSGYNRAKSEANRQKALNAELEKRGLTVADYEKIKANSQQAFHLAPNTNEIIIPPRNFFSFLNNASMEAPKGVPKIGQKGLTFVALQIDPPGIQTGKFKADGWFERFVKMEESNQRSWSRSPYIKDFEAKFAMLVDETIISVKDLKALVAWAGKYIGIGAARPQGYGRFTVGQWETVETAKGASAS